MNAENAGHAENAGYPENAESAENTGIAGNPGSAENAAQPRSAGPVGDAGTAGRPEGTVHSESAGTGADDKSAPVTPAAAPASAPSAAAPPPAAPSDPAAASAAGPAPSGAPGPYAQHGQHGAGDPYGHASQHGGGQHGGGQHSGGQYVGGHQYGGPGPQQGGWPPAPPSTPSYAGGGGNGHEWGAGYQPHQPKPKRRGWGLLAALLAGALLTGAAGGGIGYLIADGKDDGDSSSSSTTVNANTPADLKRAPTSVAGIAKRALPSVVTIEASGGNGQESGGTGFVYDQEGHILTNNHVVATAAEGGGKLSAVFPNGKKYTAEVIGRAQGYDVAVIKLKDAPDDLKPLPLGDSDKVAVGDATIAIGAPFGLNNTVTTGIVSAKDRPVASSDGGSTKASYMSALQTDASINPGNSGGPLLDSRGAVIGINSAIQSGGQGGGLDGGQPGSVGLGFAIPINQARTVATQLMKTGEPVYPVIGASVSLEGSGDGARITEEGEDGAEPVTPGGPADKAGLKPGDVITELDDTVIDSGPTLIGEIWTHKPGDKVEITYERDGEEHTVDVVLGQRTGDDK